MTRRLSSQEVGRLALGAAVLGTGGGGDPYIGQLSLEHEIELHGSPALIDLTALPDDALVAPMAMGGAPVAGLEKLLSERFAELPIRQLETRLGRKVDAIVPLEIGGVNALLPFMAASRLGLPVVDADSMGRAYPTLHNTTLHIFGMRASPMISVNEHGDAVTFDTDDNEKCERMARAIISEWGASACSVLFPLSGKDAKRVLIPKTVSLALAIGAGIEKARSIGRDPLLSIIEELSMVDKDSSARVLFEGKVVDVVREVTGGYNVGRGRLVNLYDDRDEADFIFQNEYLELSGRGRTIATVPDLICFLDLENAQPVTCELLRYGMRVKVLGIRAPEIMRSDAGLLACGPRAFGLKSDYRPI